VELGAQLRMSGATAAVVTYEPREATELCTQLAVMIHGRIVQFGPLDDVIASPAMKKSLMFWDWPIHTEMPRSTVPAWRSRFWIPSDPVDLPDPRRPLR